MSRGNAVAILLYDPDVDAVVLIEQFRIGALRDTQNAWVMELVAGFQEEGESIEDVVRREVMEEAGAKVGRIEIVCEFYINPANTSDKIILTYAQVDSTQVDGIHGVEDEGEDIMVHVMDFNTAIQEIQNGRVNSATPILALQWLALNRDRLINS
jgi:ADP-ribose pyrophosphatase